MDKYINEQTCNRVHELLGYEIRDMKENVIRIHVSLGSEIRGVGVKLWAVMLGIVAILGGLAVNFFVLYTRRGGA